ncbi:MAG: short-chain dehydrogenase/reductase, partial [Gemmatimonadetes bacterium]|nr:short-chain dehydrogenase/reductase [Gemmatimonadota bacterium]
MSTRFDAKTVLVAGGTGALGRAVSLAFLEEGAGVTVSYRHQDEFDALIAAAGTERDRLGGLAVDVTDEHGVSQLIETVLSRAGRLDVLVNAVGGYTDGQKLWESDAESLERMLSLNLRSGFTLARAVVPVMLRQGGGAIVNVAARAALVQSAGAAAYGASKAAAWALMNSLAAELKGTGVRVNSILPSIIDSE